MNVADIGKQVVFNLKVETAYIPGEPPTLVAKIGGRQQLMNGPAVFERLIFMLTVT